MRECPYCNAQMNDSAVVCPGCGEKVATGQALICPHCGSRNAPEDYFCGKCGAVLIARKTDELLPWSHDVAIAAGVAAASSGGPYLILTTDNTLLPLPATGEVVIGREDPVSQAYPEIDLASYDAERLGVSRLHARLILAENEAFIEDLGSLNATFVNKRLVKPHSRHELHSGDEIQLAGLTLVFRTG